jgi:dephospho-CoA kinase
VIIGLTGGICTGKSTAAAALMQLGVHVVDCDVIAHYLSDYDPRVRDDIRQRFGDWVFARYGALDRRQLGEFIFRDPLARSQLEAILHPTILRVVRANIDAARSASHSLVVVIPLLFELELQILFDETWLVACSKAVQLERLRTIRGYPLEEAEKRIEAQWPLDKKAALSTRILNNDATIADFENTITSTWESLKAL